MKARGPERPARAVRAVTERINSSGNDTSGRESRTPPAVPHIIRIPERYRPLEEPDGKDGSGGKVRARCPPKKSSPSPRQRLQRRVLK